jgi:formylglycine-generating enzyme required for sulfatase activity
VDFSLGFWLAETACSQALWTAVMGKNPSRFTDDLENPVENVRWEMAAELIENINSRVPGLSLRLPSEAEWEYACRAGTTTPFSFGDSLTPGDANYNGTFPYGKGKKGEYRGRTMPVKSFRPNPWGLYQMHGNVWEWCQDIWHDNYTGAPANGRAWLEGGDNERRVCRGGSLIHHGRYLRSASRNIWFYDNVDLGLRLARGPEEQEIKERSR